LRVQQFPGSAVDAIQRVSQFVVVTSAGKRQLDGAGTAYEEFDVELVLQRLHLMADRGVGDIQLGGRVAEAAVTRRGFKGA
jgi:hypothetical protein